MKNISLGIFTKIITTLDFKKRSVFVYSFYFLSAAGKTFSQ